MAARGPLTSLCPEAEKNFSSIQDAGFMDIAVPLDRLPCCGSCQALARPEVMWFEEKPSHLDEINSLVFKADIGTSSTVISIYPCN
jgi:NAD-dependent deacetylase sirtuin 5